MSVLSDYFLFLILKDLPSSLQKKLNFFVE